LVYQTLKLNVMPTAPYEKEEPKLCEECGGILDSDYFCIDCGAEANYGDTDDYYEEWREQNEH